MFVCAGIALALVAPVRAELPAVARPELGSGAASARDPRGLVFFLATDAPPGVAAVGTAHTLTTKRLAEAERVDFYLAGSRRFVASSRHFLVPPGRPFSLPNTTLRDDFMVFALEDRPRRVRVLEATAMPDLAPGLRVKILGAPAAGKHDEDAVYGRVAEVTPTRIDVDLDVPHALSGWGGAPILLARTGGVVGLLEAHVPQGTTARAIGAPISGVLNAMARPLEDGAGRPFAAFAKTEADASNGSDAGERAGERAPGLLGQIDDAPTRVHLTIDFPADGAVVADSICGVFVSGRAHALRGSRQRFDVMMVIDTSRSTIDPAGADINGNGRIGQQRLGRLGSIFGSGTTDSGDSILAAEVAAARHLLRGLDPRSTRVGLVVFAGDPGGGGWAYGNRKAAYTMEPLTRDYSSIERALDDLLERDPEGNTHMAAGVDQATIELMGLRGATSTTDPKAEKIVFFFTDGQPTLPYGAGMEADNVRAVLRAANRAHRGGVRIHSFAIGPDALAGPIATVEMASRTEGYFTPVRHPGDLVDLVEEVSFANLDEVAVTSRTTGEPAKPYRITADGAWAGLVRMVPGENRVHVRARADDGAETQKTLKVTFVPEAPTPPLPNDFVVQRNRLLEDCLRDTKQLRLQAEQERAEAVRRELRVEIERERAKARERAAEQRKELQIEVEPDDIRE
jgi:hypothetical protein